MTMPKVLDLSNETDATLKLYGMDEAPRPVSAGSAS